ncbi:MAG TPA: GNAT family N-acetyltransferase [Ignavibacteria bacterium]|nr:GNAT family N-acetyltransferase [Ignavibacteria bacterium]HMR40662.1 GNAT family N-acetyltransferase [Ignavibacteria bacterium]
MSENSNIKIRKAKKKDSKKILKLIKELAIFEKLDFPDKNAAKRLIKDAFSKDPLFQLLAIEFENQIAGYVIYYYTYSSFLAKRSLYLEDIFISEDFRGKGIGRSVFKKLIKIAKKNECGRIEWIVLDWNQNAINFYDNLGARHLHDWKTYRISL